MDIFCQECGTKGVKGENRCRECGSELVMPKEEPPQRSQKPSQPMSKKRKTLIGILVGVIVIILSLFFYLKNYYSQESVEKRFQQALMKENAGVIEKLGIHGDGSDIAKAEAEAFIKLERKDRQNVVHGLYRTKYIGKALGLFDEYKIEFIDQFIYTEDYGDGVELLLDQQTVKKYSEDEDWTTYGPLIPGIYTFQFTYDNKFAKGEMEVEAVLADEYGEETDIDLAQFDYTNISLNRHDQFEDMESYLLINDNKIELDEYGTADDIGPIPLDGSLSVQVVTAYPWGEIQSEPVLIDDYSLSVNNGYFTEEQYEEIKQLVSDFGEQTVEAMVNKTTDVYSVTTKNFNKEMDELIEYSFPKDLLLNGRLNQIHIDKESFEYDDNAINISILLEFELGENEKEFYEDYWDHNISIIYNEKDKKWSVDNWGNDGWYSADENVDTMKGSEKIYKPDDKVVKAAKETAEDESDSDIDSVSLDDELEAIVEKSNIAHVRGINEQEYDSFLSLTTADGPRREEARKYMVQQAEKGMKQEHLSTRLENVEKVDGHTYKVTTIETYTIKKPNEDPKENTYRTVNIVKEVDGEFLIHKLDATDIAD